MSRSSLAVVLLVLLLSIPVAVADLSPTERAVVRHAEANFAGAIEFLARTVDIPSATENLAGMRELSRLYEEAFSAIGFETEWVPLPPETGRAGHFIARHRGQRGPHILFIGHLDTVLESEPWRRDGNIAYGSGVADMKGGNLVILEALRALHQAHLLEDRAITVVFTGDEESPGHPLAITRKLLVDAAKEADIALAYEEAGEGTAVVGRRGIATWKLEVTAETGHSSVVFSERIGSGAIYEAARILNGFHETLREPNLTYNAAVIAGGTEIDYDDAENRGSAHGKSNVVPARAVAKGDLRFITRDQLERSKQKMLEIVSRHLPKTTASIEFTEGYPAMSPTEGNRRLLEIYDRVSRDLGYGPVEEYDPGKRGAGDVSFVAEHVDALDGLGAFGERSHAPGESVDIEKLRMQIARTALLIERLGD